MGERRMARRTPQDKKQLSYDRDRRNNYGENDKSSRKSIRRNKRYPNRANRRRDRQALGAAVGAVDEPLAEAVDQNVHNKRRKRWRKWPDAPLGVHVRGLLQRRQQLEADCSERLAARVRRLQARYTRVRVQGNQNVGGW